MLAFILFILGAILFLVLSVKSYDDWNMPILTMFTGTTAGLLICAVIMVGIGGLITNIGLSGQIASDKQEYESLIYQLENNIYDNDNDLGKKELYDQITEWNTEVAEGKVMQNDIWFGMLWADKYAYLELIELPNVE